MLMTLWLRPADEKFEVLTIVLLRIHIMNFTCTSFGGERDSTAQNMGPDLRVTCNLVRRTNCGKKNWTELPDFRIRLRSVICDVTHFWFQNFGKFLYLFPRTQSRTNMFWWSPGEQYWARGMGTYFPSSWSCGWRQTCPRHLLIIYILIVDPKIQTLKIPKS